MTARRGSLRFKVARLAAGRSSSTGGRRSSAIYRWIQRATVASGRMLAVAAIGLIVATFAVQAARVAYANYQLHVQIVAAENDNRSLESQIVTLRREIVLSRDPEYLVPLVHEQLGLAKPREVFVRFAPVVQPPTPESTARPQAQ